MNDMRMKRLIGKWALVTGGSRGIGKAICLELAKEGANIVVNYVSDDKAAGSTVKAIKDLGVDTYEMCADVSNREQVQSMVNAVTKNNPIDILVNNAGIVEFQPFLEITPESWDRIYRTN